jgi:hypothetical protein
MHAAPKQPHNAGATATQGHRNGSTAARQQHLNSSIYSSKNAHHTTIKQTPIRN